MLSQIIAFIVALAVVITLFILDPPGKQKKPEGPVSIQSGEQLDWALAHGLTCNRVANQYTCN